MTLAAGRVEDGLIRQVQEALGERSLAAQLAEALYAHNGLEGMPATPAWLASQARSALEFISEKPRKKHKLRIRPLEGEPGRPEGTAVEILNDDMPFLVDSVVAELQARGLAVRSLLHPIFKTERDSSGRLQALLGPATRTGTTATRKATSPSTSRGCRRPANAISPKPESTFWSTCASRSPTGSRCCARCATRSSSWKPAPQVSLRASFSESVAFLRWLEAGNFTFLGLREYRLAGASEPTAWCRRTRRASACCAIPACRCCAAAPSWSP